MGEEKGSPVSKEAMDWADEEMRKINVRWPGSYRPFKEFAEEARRKATYEPVEERKDGD